MLASVLMPVMQVSAAATHTIWFKPPWSPFGGAGTNEIANASDSMTPDGGYARIYFYSRSGEIAEPANFTLGWGDVGASVATQYLVDLVGPGGNSASPNGAMMDCQGFPTEWFPLGAEDDLVTVIDKDSPAGGYTTSSDIILTGADPDYPPGATLYKIGGTYGNGTAGINYLEAIRTGPASTDLQWPAIGDANTNVYGYRVYRNSTVEPVHAIGNLTAGAGTTGFVDNTCAAGTTYTYTISVLYRGQQGGLENPGTVVESLYDSFPVLSIPDVDGPVIVKDNAVSSPNTVTAGNPINVTVNVTDNVMVQQVLLNWTDVDSSTNSMAMTLWSGDTTDGVWSADIPTATVGTVYYYIWVVDNSGNSAVEPAGAPGNNYTVNVVANVPDHIVITPDGDTMPAGTNKTFTITLYDVNNNVATALANTQIDLTGESGTSQFNETNTANVITFVTIPMGASVITFDYYDETNGTWWIRGNNNTLDDDFVNITVEHLGLASFTIIESTTAPNVPLPAWLNITALDIFGNTVLDHAGLDTLTQSNATSPLLITWGPDADLVPAGDGNATLNVGAWNNGVANIWLNYPLADNGITVTVENNATTISQASQEITWQIGGLNHFYIVVEDTTPVVGNPVWINISAKDSGNNTMTSYASADSLLSIGDGGPLLPFWAGDALDLGTGDATAILANWIKGTINVTLIYNISDDPVTPRIDTGSVQTNGPAITWQDGPAVEFLIAVSDTAPVAGTASTVTITAIDQFGNIVQSYDEDCSITQNGGGAAATLGTNGANGQLDIGEWTNGVTSFTATYNTAYDPMNFTIKHIGSGVPVNNTLNITWVPDILDWFNVTENTTLPGVGMEAMMTVVANDQFDNIIITYNMQTNIAQVGASTPTNLVFSGTGVVGTGPGTAQIQAAGWTNGIAFVNVSYNIAGDPTAFDYTRGLVTSSSSPITWQASGIDHFYIMESDLNPIAGYNTMLTIEAKDNFNNTITTFNGISSVAQAGASTTASIVYSGTNITDNGDGTGQIEIVAWTLGVSFVNISYTVAYEPITFTIGGMDTSQAIIWLPDILDHYYITADTTSPTAGMPATLTITAKDQFNNTKQNYTNNVELTQIGASMPTNIQWFGVGVTDDMDGTGWLNIWALGTATVQIVYDVAGEPILASITDAPITDNSPVITWIPDNLDYILVEDVTGAEAGDMPGLTTDNNVRFFSQGYDLYNNYIGNITVDWGVTGGIGILNATNGISTELDCTIPGTGVVLAYIDGMFSDITGNLTVALGALDSIMITPNPATVINGNNQVFNAVGYDADGNTVPANPTWSVGGGIGTVPAPPGPVTTFTATTLGTGRVNATDGGVSASANVTVVPIGILSIAYESGDGQAGTVNTDLPLMLVVNVTDDGNNPIAGQTIIWTIVSVPAGSTMEYLTANASFTGANGLATSQFHLGEIDGPYQIRAELMGVGTYTFVLNSNPGPLFQIVLTPNIATVIDGASQPFNATGFDMYGNSVPTNPTWTAEGGIGTAPVGPGTSTTFTATDVGSGWVNATDGLVTASADVTVIIGPAANLNYVSGQGLGAVANIDLAQNFVVSVTDGQGNPVPGTMVVWAITGIPTGSIMESLSTITSLTNGAGEASVLFHVGEIVGMYTVEAMAMGLAGSPYSFYSNATADVLDTIIVTPASVTLLNGGNQTFNATGFDQYGNSVPTNPTWTVTGGIGSAAPSPGASTTFTATAQGAGTLDAADGLVTASVTINVVDIIVDYVVIEYSANGTEVQGHMMNAGDTLSLQAMGYNFTYGPVGLVAVDWQSTGTLDHLTNLGATTWAFAPQTATTYGTIDISHVTFGTIDSGLITVSPGALATATVAPDSMTIQIDQTLLFTASGEDAYGNAVPLPAFTWMTENGTIDTNGIYTPADLGTFNVSANISGTLYNVSVTVIAGDLADITITPSGTTITTDDTQQFAVYGTDSMGNNVTVDTGSVTWDAQDGAITIGGLYTPGRTGIWKVYALVDGIIATTNVTVASGALSSIQIVQSIVNIDADTTFQFNITGYDASGSMNAGFGVPDVTWSATNGTIVNGLFTPWATGTWTITATNETLVSTATVIVISGVPTSIIISATSAATEVDGTRDSAMTVGDYVFFNAIGMDARGNTIPLAGVEWITTVGTISNGLLYAGTIPGNGLVTATYGGLINFENITINVGPLHHIIVTTANLITQIEVGQGNSFVATGYDVYGNVLTGQTFTWSVAPEVGTVDATGTFTATESGIGSVIATSGSVSGEISVFIPEGKGIFQSWLWLVIILIIVVVVLLVMLLGRKERIIEIPVDEDEIEELSLVDEIEIPDEFNEPVLDGHEIPNEEIMECPTCGVDIVGNLASCPECGEDDEIEEPEEIDRSKEDEEKKKYEDMDSDEIGQSLEDELATELAILEEELYDDDDDDDLGDQILKELGDLEDL